MLEFSNQLTVDEYCELRSAVNWQPLVYEQAEAGLNNTDFIVACRENEKVVGCARIFWDKGYIAYLSDVMVKPEYQGHGIGKKMVTECVSYIDKQLKEGWRVKIVVLSAKGKEEFYKKFGFTVRPDETEGAGMQMWRDL